MAFTKKQAEADKRAKAAIDMAQDEYAIELRKVWKNIIPKKLKEDIKKERPTRKAATGGMIGRKKKTGDARKAPKPQPYHQDTSTHKRFVHKSTLKKYANSVRGVRWPEDWEQQ